VRPRIPEGTPPVKLFLFEVAVLSFVSLLIASYFFRSRQAREVLRRLRFAGWVYVAMVLAVAALELLRRGW
jgi:hypothetical protein